MFGNLLAIFIGLSNILPLAASESSEKISENEFVETFLLVFSCLCQSFVFVTWGRPGSGIPARLFARLFFLARKPQGKETLAWSSEKGGGGLQSSGEVGGLVGGRLSSVLTARRRQKSLEDQVAGTGIQKRVSG